MTSTRDWRDISPTEAEAENLNLAHDTHITAPLNEQGDRCPWPWQPQQLTETPLGQYRCGYCGALVVAGEPHIDYAPEERTVTRGSLTELLKWCEPSELRYEAVDGSSECVGLTVRDLDGALVPARFGDVILRDGYGLFTVRQVGS